MAVSSGKTVFGQAMSYALSKVGDKPEMVLKNEQLTAIQHVYDGKDVFVHVATDGIPIAFRQHDKKYWFQTA